MSYLRPQAHERSTQRPRLLVQRAEAALVLLLLGQGHVGYGAGDLKGRHFEIYDAINH